jgi:hypothetical protein
MKQSLKLCIWKTSYSYQNSVQDKKNLKDSDFKFEFLIKNKTKTLSLGTPEKDQTYKSWV